MPPRAGRVGTGEVEGAEQPVEVLAVDEPVDRAAGGRRCARDETERPPIVVSSRLETASKASRVASKSSRRRLNFQTRRFSGSLSRRSRRLSLLCW